MNPIPVNTLGSSALQEEYDKYAKLYDYYNEHNNILYHRVLGFEQFIKKQPWFFRWIYTGSANLTRWREESIANMYAMDICMERMNEIKKAMEK